MSVTATLARPDGATFATAEQAVAARAWEDAARIWREEAAAGRPEAHLGLGNLWDLGVLGRRDQARALAYYRKAAEAGLPVAAFNVGAMHAAGAGTARDMQSAARWYARAALDGHDRAAFALGHLFATGDGLPRNAEIAEGWLHQASRSIPAAADALATLEQTPATALAAPEPLALRIGIEDGQRWAAAAWSAAPASTRATVRVEIALRGPTASLLAATESRIGAVRLPIPETAEDLIWRVVALDPSVGDYAASEWHDAALRAVPATTAGGVSFRTGAQDRKARAAARSATGPLRRAGLRVDLETLEDRPRVSTVRYRYIPDAALARDVARFLPAFGAEDVVHDPALDARPGEIVVVLSFD